MGFFAKPPDETRFRERAGTKSKGGWLVLRKPHPGRFTGGNIGNVPSELKTKVEEGDTH